MRRFLLLVAALLGGCGKSEQSFLELDAIYKEESAVLESVYEKYVDEKLHIEQEYQQKANRRANGLLTPAETAEMEVRQTQLKDRFEPLMDAQEKKVKQIKANREAAKEAH